MRVQPYRIPAAHLYPTPSAKDGVSEEEEFQNRAFAAEVIQEAGIRLKLPQNCVATALFIFHRFFFRCSMKAHDITSVAMASTFIAAKVEECPRRNRDVINVFNACLQKRRYDEKWGKWKEGKGKDIEVEQPPFQAIPITYESTLYAVIQKDILHTEKVVLKELGFILGVEHPHKLVLVYCLHALRMEADFAQCAYNYVNDCFRTGACVEFGAEVVACAGIALAAKEKGVSLPTPGVDDVDSPWHIIFGVQQQELEEVITVVENMYKQAPFRHVILSPSHAILPLNTLQHAEAGMDGALAHLEQIARARDGGGEKEVRSESASRCERKQEEEEGGEKSDSKAGNRGGSSKEVERRDEEATAERETAITDRMARAGEKEAETEMGATGEEKAVGEMIVEEKTGGETTAREVREIETGMAMTEIGETDIEVEGMKRTDTEEMREEGAKETTTGEREEVTDGNSEMTREVGEGRDDRGGTKK
eukprot:CAMPEP_0113868044 /NCGR_PEP_ID=MMETSP0780_2-20120614/759_1 /TAXON_ID=652834 /ORGANISM="Palpitomonas bilix" /LENGTH=478 /DNA_ID=CAMNT_0000853061 /DNA_START=359 /DNA_END=1796 /DNA_ORIENTATION=- /assembly_acc=CAM_ASM_000599